MINRGQPRSCGKFYAEKDLGIPINLVAFTALKKPVSRVIKNNKRRQFQRMGHNNFLPVKRKFMRHMQIKNYMSK
jgi:hypothetical protein